MAFIMQRQTSCSGNALPFLITGGNFSLGTESMNQSKIAVGNKKYCPSQRDYKIIYYGFRDTFPDTVFH